MSEDDIEKQRTDRRWGRNYLAEDHSRVAHLVSEEHPRLFEWIKTYGGFRGFDDESLQKEGYEMETQFWEAVAQALPNSTLFDKSDVLIELRQVARPLSPEDRRWLEEIALRSEERKRKRSHSEK